MRLLIGLVFALASTLQAMAAPQDYSLDAGGSEVALSVRILGAATRAKAPVAKADLALDFAQINRSSVDVVVAAAKVTTAVPFVAQTMKSADILDVSRFPDVRFVSRSVALKVPGDINGGATIRGDLTIKGVTRPATFDARLFRKAGSAADDLSQLTIKLTGAIDRREFGISAYAKEVGPEIAFDITARIAAR